MSTERRILLVEDDPEDAELTLQALSRRKASVTAILVRDGREALDYLHRRGRYAEREFGDPNVILLDLRLPREDGMTVLREVRSDPVLRLIPVVILSSSTQPQDRATAYALGANGYVEKPAEFTALMDTLEVVTTFWAECNEPPRDPRLVT